MLIQQRLNAESTTTVAPNESSFGASAFDPNDINPRVRAKLLRPVLSRPRFGWSATLRPDGAKE